MSAPDISVLAHARVRVIHGPTDIDGADTGGTPDTDYGGTRLGAMKGIEWLVDSAYGEVEGWEYHSTVIETIEGGVQRIAVGGLLRQFDSDTISAVLGSADPMAWTMTTRRGGLGSSRAVALLLAPVDVDLPALYIPRAVPQLQPSARIAFALRDEWTLPIMWLGLPDGSGRSHQLAKLKDITL